jgi:hypothetical protein
MVVDLSVVAIEGHTLGLAKPSLRYGVITAGLMSGF